MTVNEHIRQHLLDNVVGFPRNTKPVPDLDELRRTRWSPEFEQYMRNRLVMGAIRYRVWEGERGEHDYAGEIIRRAKRYIQDGNLEHLVDAANFCLVEFVTSSHPQKHWGPQDDAIHANPI